MTCKENLRELYPDYESLLKHVIDIDCPEDYMDIKEPEFCDPLTEACERCWLREIYEEPTQVSMSEHYEALETQPHIKDSGDRTQFETGAVRDMREGKGRCDLMPLEVVRDLIADTRAREILDNVHLFLKHGDADFLKNCLDLFARHIGGCDTYQANVCTMFLEVAKHFEEGAKKYGENNWQKGIPVKCYIDSAVRHYLKWLRGDKDEPHDRAFVWNLMCCIWEVDYHEKAGE